jgi:hypothetical protein
MNSGNLSQGEHYEYETAQCMSLMKCPNKFVSWSIVALQLFSSYLNSEPRMHSKSVRSVFTIFYP